MSTGILGSYRKLQPARQTLLILVEKEMGLGPDVALGLFGYMTDREPDFPATLNEFQLEDVRKLATLTRAQVQI